MKGIRLLKRLASAIKFEHTQESYAQAGEDRVLRFLFDLLGVPHPTYLDIGAHHPTYLSNTYLFYKQGARGVCVEPDPTLHQRIQQKRPRDVCLNIGVATGEDTSLEFYVFDNATMNTFSPEIRDEQIANGRVNTQCLQIPVANVNDVIEHHLPGVLHLVSLDTEGWDLIILQSFNFEKCRPTAFCIETLENTIERKIAPIIDFMISKNYRIFADTYLNTIFVDNNVWNARPSIAVQVDAVP
ncbi:MAG: FkbM family methyltransferase [Chthoniobacterales bacterium]